MANARSTKTKGGTPRASRASGGRGRSTPSTRGATAASTEPARQQPDELARVPQQERGQRRMESILDAAEQVFVELGVDAASTNAIAERAGASVGSIYHFFPSKDAIVLALAARYAERMRELNAQAMPLEALSLPVEEVMERVIGGHERFTNETPAFNVVAEATTRKYGSCAVNDQLEAAIMGQVRTYLTHRLPRLSPARREAATRLSVTTIGEVIDGTVGLPRNERDAIVRELKEMMTLYFTSLDEQYGVRRG